MSGGDDKQLQQFIDAGADNVIQKPAKTETLVDILLTGLEMAVVFDWTQHKPTPVTSATKPITVLAVNSDKELESNKDGESNVRDVEMVRQEHRENLLKFLTETKAKANVKARAVFAPTTLATST